MFNKEKTIFETLHIDTDDFNKMVDVLQKPEINMDLHTKGKQIKELNIKKKDICFALFMSRMLEDAASHTTTTFFTETPKLSQQIVTDTKLMKDAVIYINAFLQGTNSDNPTVKLFSVFIPVIVLISSPVTPLSIAVDLFVKLIKFHKFSYGEILVGMNVFLTTIDPIKKVPEHQVN